jgi:hypothetical protein
LYVINVIYLVPNKAVKKKKEKKEKKEDCEGFSAKCEVRKNGKR